MQQDDFESEPYDRALLRLNILGAINDTVLEFFRTATPPSGVEPADISEAEQSAYELGEYLVKQNPYSRTYQIDLPEIPGGPLEETRRVRKTGVLKDRHSQNKLPESEPIPGGQVFDFVYPDLHSIADDEFELDDVAPDSVTTGDNLNKKRVYQHNVVKIIRFRYSLLNRETDTQPSPAYILALYSGADG